MSEDRKKLPTDGDRIDAEAALIGILALLAADRDERASNDIGTRKAEMVLADAGMGVAQVARVLGRNYDAVRMSIARTRAADSVKARPAKK